MIAEDANQGLADKLYLVKYEIDEENCHLIIKDEETCRRCEEKPCIDRCPAEGRALTAVRPRSTAGWKTKRYWK